MTTILHLDASARSGRSGIDPHGSHTRRLSARFVEQWQQRCPEVRVIYRDVGQNPPPPVTGAWIHAAFTPQAQRESWMHDTLRVSDALVDELLAADVIVAGVPMYNFGPPAQFKAWIDNIVRVGRTFGFDRKRSGEPYWPMLADMDKRVVLLSARGDYGYESGKMHGKNHVEPAILTALAYLGISQSHTIAVEYDEFADERLAQSLADAEAVVDRLVEELSAATGQA